jgi:protein tyrosine/serine phosphatase
VALTHALLGIDEATIFNDYLLTNTAVDVAARMPQIEASLSAYAGRPVSAAVVKPFLGVEADYLARALAAIHSQHGTIERYVVDVLSVDRADIDALRRTFIV